ncbi:hypothetical protein QMK33_17680 [Hymenobacter sp. H14-R3]|uniref:hypothetical protein n=1 Tax=Hymenobacter sp. H14-R3 TaxID=3046308 RepID=UPI0024B9FE22|nr:hypothetical protein [Hymenobacter sp. H14-R3]MDJ0366983.1 hypothetical protein [Hymenobacter sp. H14-R3]
MDYVYSLDWYDGPRSGIADYNGQPYFFESQWSNIGNGLGDWYKLSPVSKEVLQLELERWRLWKKYEVASKVKAVGEEHHPFLPSDQTRGEQLTILLEGRLGIDEHDYLIAEAIFEPVLVQPQQENNAEMVVCWTILTEAPCESRKRGYNP